MNSIDTAYVIHTASLGPAKKRHNIKALHTDQGNISNLTVLVNLCIDN